LLQEIFERGSLMTQDGETVYFSYATFMLISNLGAEIIDEDATKRLEYAEKCDAVRNILEDEVKKRFLPGFLNAINKVIYFSPLKDEWLKQIAKDKIRLVLVRLEAKGYTVEINGAIEDFLFKNMPSSIRFGARYMNKAIEENILKPLSQYMLNCNKRHFFISIADDKKLEFRCE
jgi:ATP-dependent Clp protease ATP-binding subunit ClpA